MSPKNRFGILYTVVSDNGKQFVSKDLLDWLAAQRRRRLTGRESCSNIENKLEGLQQRHWYIDKVLFSHRKSSNARGDTPAKVLLGKKVRNPVVGFLKLVNDCCTNPLQTMSRKN